MEKFFKLEEKKLRQLAEKEAFEVWKAGLPAWVISKREVAQKILPEQREEFVQMATKKLSEYKSKDLLEKEEEKSPPLKRKPTKKKKGMFGGLFS